MINVRENPAASVNAALRLRARVDFRVRMLTAFLVAPVGFWRGRHTFLLIALLSCWLPAEGRAAQVRLGWDDNADNEDGFRIERAEGGAGFSEIGRVGANITTYTDAGLKAGTTYSYRVRAYNSYGDSGYSNVADGTTPVVLPVNQAPVVSGPGDQRVMESESTGPLSFSVGDTQTPPGQLLVTATSSDAGLVPAAGIVLGGLEGSRTIGLTPASGRSGTAQITISVSDGALTSSASFALVVQALPAPVVTQVPEVQTVTVGGSAILTVIATGARLTYQWYVGMTGDTGTPINGATASSFVTPGLSTTTRYWVRIWSGAAWANSPTMTVVVPAVDRFFFGEIGANGEGTFAYVQRADGSAQIYACMTGDGSSIDGEQVSVTDGGAFSLASSKMGGIQGQVLGSTVTGTLTARGLSFAGTADNVAGTTQAYAGASKGVVINTPDGNVSAVAGPGGRAWVLLVQAGIGRGGLATLGADGRLSATHANAWTFAGTVDAPSGRLVGSVATTAGEKRVTAWRSGSTPAEAFANTSVRARIRSGDRGMIAGFVVGGAGSKRVLLRGVGPSLGAYGVDSAAADPRIILHRLDMGTHAVWMAENDDWGRAPNAAQIASLGAAAGAFDLPVGSKDAALLVDLPAGLYTAQVTNAGNAEGTAIVEIYEVDEVAGRVSTATLSNISLRSATGSGSTVPIAGFIFGGTIPKRVLVRAVGPELAGFGVDGALADPRLSLFHRVDGNEVEIASTSTWRDDADAVGVAADSVGAFALAPGSKSAAMVIWLEPGAYTAVVESASSASGVALIEVYEVE